MPPHGGGWCDRKCHEVKVPCRQVGSRCVGWTNFTDDVGGPIQTYRGLRFQAGMDVRQGDDDDIILSLAQRCHSVGKVSVARDENDRGRSRVIDNECKHVHLEL